MEKEKTKITVGHIGKGISYILSWIFGILFIMTGMGVMITSPFWGIVIILCAAMLIPYFDTLIAEKFNIEISGGIKFILVIIIFVAMGFGMSSTAEEASERIQATDTQTVETTEKVETSTTIKTTEAKTIETKYLDKTYDDLWAIFSPSSRYTDLSKENIFATEYYDEYVKWTGTVYEIDASVLDNLRLYINHQGGSGYDITVYVNNNQYQNLLKLKKGDSVTYTAKFSSYSSGTNLFGDGYLSFVMNDGEIID
ncbi:hypothetical protein HZC31_00100 [Candidatus Woesearchaeota archaeon]|nr:hypothetical protein [Candidatus Woesearchaeota archaeon]